MGEQFYSIEANKPILVEFLNNVHTDGFSLIAQEDLGKELSPVRHSTKNKGPLGINPILVGIGAIILILVIIFLLKIKPRKH